MKKKIYYTFRDKDNKYEYDIYLKRVPFETLLSSKIDFLERQGKDININRTNFSSEVLDIIEEYINYGQLLICESFRDMFNIFKETNKTKYDEVEEKVLHDVLMILIYDETYDQNIKWRTMWIRIKLEEQWATHNNDYNNIIFNLDDEEIRIKLNIITRTSDLFYKFVDYINNRYYEHIDPKYETVYDLNPLRLLNRNKTNYSYLPRTTLVNVIKIVIGRANWGEIYTLQIDNTKGVDFRLTSILYNIKIYHENIDDVVEYERGSDSDDITKYIYAVPGHYDSLYLIFTDALNLLTNPYLPYWHQLVTDNKNNYISTDSWLFSYLTNQHIIDSIKFDKLLGYKYFIQSVLPDDNKFDGTFNPKDFTRVTFNDRLSKMKTYDKKIISYD